LIQINKKINLKIAIIGAGRLGTTIGYFIADKNLKNIKIVSISTPTKKTINRAKKIFGKLKKNILFTNSNAIAAEKANCIFICTPDDLIAKACESIYDKQENRGREKTVIHFSGSRSLKELEAARKNGDCAASIHPLKSIASIPEAIKTLKGTEYGITYIDKKGEDITKLLVDILEGSSIVVQDDTKPVYHAAACIASNYLVALIDYAVYINEKIGIKPGESTRGLINLIEGTVDNIKKMGTKKSLTGPIARGDTGTVGNHLKIFEKVLDKKDTEIYRIMGEKTADIARGNGWIDADTYNKLLKLLKDK